MTTRMQVTISILFVAAATGGVIGYETLGDGAEWAELFELNRGRPQPDGGTLADPSLIRPGWVLALSASTATPTGTPASPPPAPAPPSVLSGVLRRACARRAAAVQHLPHLEREPVRGERLLDERHRRAEHAVVQDHVVRVPGHEEHADVGALLDHAVGNRSARVGERAHAAGVKIHFIVANVLHLPNLGAPFAFFFDRGCYHAVRREEPQQYASAVAPHLAPGGRGLILAGNASEPHDPGPPVVTEQQIRDELGVAFQILDLHEFRFDEAPGVPERFLGWSCLVEKR